MKLYRMDECCGKYDPNCTSPLEQYFLALFLLNLKPCYPRADHISYDSAVRVNPMVVSTYLDEDAASQLHGMYATCVGDTSLLSCCAACAT